MIKTIPMAPGVTLRCFSDSRFKQGCLSIQYLRPMCNEEAAQNALLPSILLSGCASAPDMREISLRLADLYGASVVPLVRRVGNIQTTGLYCSFIEEQYAMAGDRILAPLADFLCELLLRPVLQDGAFRADYVESEKANQISSVEAQLNDKRAYTQQQLLLKMCGDDSFSIPATGTVEEIAKITPQSACNHYHRVLEESPIEIFYLGTQSAQTVASLLQPLTEHRSDRLSALPAHTAFSGEGFAEYTQHLPVTQGKLCMGFSTPITIRDPAYPAMYVLSVLYGGGMTNKLFTQIREKQSLCYDIGALYVDSKGILLVSAGADFEKCALIRQKVLRQLTACCDGDFTASELDCAKQSILSALRSVEDTPAGMERFYCYQRLLGTNRTPEALFRMIEAVDAAQVAEAAKTVSLHCVYELKGEAQ